MSYILDALRKADRDRQVARVPTLATTHASTTSLRRPVWIWAIAGVLAVTAGVAYVVRSTPERPVPARQAGPPRAATSPAPPPGASVAPPTPASPAPATAPRRDAAMAPAPGPVPAPPAASVAPARPPVAPAAPPVTVAPARPPMASLAPPQAPSQVARAGGDPLSPRATPGAAETPATGRAVPARPGVPREPGVMADPRAGASVATPPTVGTVPPQAAEAGRVAPRPAPAAPPAVAPGAATTAEPEDDDDDAAPPFTRMTPAPSESGRAPVDQAPRGPRRVVRRPPVIPASPAAPVGSASPAPRVEAAAVPPPAAATARFAAGAGAAPAPAAAPPLARFTLDVLVYSEVPAERLVFINGRKYVEGQALDTDAVVERITPEGAVLRYQGTQLVLRPKLNPYARP